MDVTFNSLPLEIQTEICSYLSPTELQNLFAPVCKTWKEMASQPTLRKEITFHEGDLLAKTRVSEYMINVIRKSFRLNRLVFVFIESWYALSRGLPACNYLRTLELKACEIKPRCAKLLVARFPNIENVRLVFVCSQKIDFSLIKRIAKWRFLKSISIDTRQNKANYQGKYTQLLKIFATRCKYLKNLELLNFRISGRAITLLTKLRGPTLEKLNVRVFPEYSTFRTNRMTRCLRRCPQLKVLHLDYVSGFPKIKHNKMLEELYVNISHLDKLLRGAVVLNHLHKLEIQHSPFSMQLLPTHCPALKWLEIKDQKTRNETVIYIARHCSNLERLVIRWSKKVTSDALRDIVNLENTTLNYLKFSRCDFFKETDALLAEANMLKPNLQTEIKFCALQLEKPQN